MLDTAAIQRAIDACTAAGGGVVDVPPGLYRSGTIFLKDGVELRLEAGARILGSAALADYPPTPALRHSYTENYTERSLIHAGGRRDVAITGRGVLDGNGFAFERGDEYKRRPYLMRFDSCCGVLIRDVTLRDPAMWTQHYLACDDVRIDGVTVRARHANVNGDGIDIDSCARFVVANCNIDCQDDAIVLKSTCDRACRDVVVENCVLSTLCNAIKLGTESNGGFENIKITGCSIYDTRLSGIALETVDGGSLERVIVSDITMDGVGNAIFLRHGARDRPFADGQAPIAAGRFRDVVIANVVADRVGSVGCPIAGLADRRIENVTLSNIVLRFAGGGEPVAGEVPEHPARYPEFGMFGRLPAYGFWVRHADGIRFDNVRIGYAEPDMRPAIVTDDVTGLEIAALRAQPPGGASALIRVARTRGALIDGCRVDGEAAAFLEVLEECAGLVITGCDARAAREVVRGAVESAVVR